MTEPKRVVISFSVDDFEYQEITLYARAKGHGGQTPASTFAHYATFQMMKKYPLTKADIAKYTKKQTENNNVKTVQPKRLKSKINK
ncbi:MAG: hypothetical protein FWD78_02985 [Treponema sp.]|nr:hypothetical protein [Treponema sp.]